MKSTLVASSEEAQGAQLVDQRAVDRGLGIEVEVGQAPGRGQRGEALETEQAPGGGGRHLDGQQALQQRGRSELLGPGLLEHRRQRLRGGRQAQRREMAPQLLVDRRLAHRRASTSSA
jgi:hypothetical protein